MFISQGLLDGVRALERGSLGKHLNVAYHLVQIRGVSTTLLQVAVERMVHRLAALLLQRTIYVQKQPRGD